MLHALLLAATLGAGTTPDPYQMFSRARAYWLAQTYPSSMRYQVVVAVTEGGKTRAERYDTAYDAVTGQIAVDEVSDYERAHPVNPTGANMNLLVWHNKPLQPIDWLGVPRLTPTYSFGMAPFVPAPVPTPTRFDSAALVDEIRNEYHDPNPRASVTPSPAPTMHEIATVVSRSRDYAITFVGTDSIDGHACYHLALQPERDPSRFRIRQAWIDESTYATWQLVDVRNFRSSPGGAIPWTIHFEDVGGAHYIREEDAGAEMSNTGETFSNVSVSFDFTPNPGPRLYAQTITVPLLDEP